MLTLLFAPLLSLAWQGAAEPEDLRVAPVNDEPTPAAANAGTETGPVDVSADAATALERRDIALLHALEGRLAVGTTLSTGDVDVLLRLASLSPSPRARALAAAVLPWLDPSVAAVPLFAASHDPDARVRASAGQSLVALARRLNEDLQRSALAVGMSLLEDASDEAACAGAELLSALNPPNLGDTFAVRAQAASEVRYACFVRSAGLAPRAVTMPEMPPDPDEGKAPTTSTPTPSPTAPAGVAWQQQPWLFLAAATGTGLLAGGALPGAVFPSRDVLLYDARETRLSREDISFVTVGGAAVLGAAALGGAALGTQLLWGPLSTTESTSVLGAAGAGTAWGAGLGLMLGLDGGGLSLSLGLGSLGGFAAGTALAYGFELSGNDNALMATAMAMGGLGSALAAFTAVPVGVDAILGAKRNDFGLGAGMTGAGLWGLVALGSGAFTEVAPARSAAVLAGGLLGGGLFTGLGFLFVPDSLDTRSRIACGLGLAGQILGMTMGMVLVPESWLGVSTEAVVDLTAKEARLGLPLPTVLSALPGHSERPLAFTLVRARF